jgi:hypothetical protein
MLQTKHNVSASNTSRILYFIVRKDWHGVLELLDAKRKWSAGYPDRLRLAKWLHITLSKVITPTPKFSHTHKPLTFRSPCLLLHNLSKCRNAGPMSRYLRVIINCPCLLIFHWRILTGSFNINYINLQGKYDRIL